MTMQRDVHDDLRARLHEAAEAHEPDRAHILARVERGMAGQGQAQERSDHRASRPVLWGWARIVGATAAVAGMLAVGGYAVASAVKDDTPAQQTVSVSPPPVESPDATSRPCGLAEGHAELRRRREGPGEAEHFPVAELRGEALRARGGHAARRRRPTTRTGRCGRTVRSIRTATTSGRRATSRSRRPRRSPH